MSRTTLLKALAAVLLATGCDREPIAPPESRVATDVIGAVTQVCPLVSLPPGAQVVACFNTTLQPGVWHGFYLSQSVSQPTGYPGGASDRTRLNRPYVLALPEGYTRWGPSDPIAPGAADLNKNVYAFQTEFNGVVWGDVLRFFAAADGDPQVVSVVVYWADATERYQTVLTPVS